MDLFSNEYLAHYGILGMKWGIRRYQNKDGTLTEEGKIRDRAANAAAKNSSGPSYRNNASSKSASGGSSIGNKIKSLATKENAKKVAIGAAVVAGTALAIYGATHYPQLASSAKGLVNSGMSAAKSVLNTGATAAPKGLSATAGAAKKTSASLKNVADLTEEIQNTLQPKNENKTEERVADAAKELSSKVADKVSEQSKAAGAVAGMATNAAVSAVGNKVSQSQTPKSTLTLEPNESFGEADMAKLMSNLDQIGRVAGVGSKVLDSVGSGAEDLASDLLKKMGNAHIG